MFLRGVALKNTCLAIFLQIIKGSLAEFIFIKIPCFHSIFFWTLLDGSTWSIRLFFEMNLILDIQTKFMLQKPRCKNFWWNYNKNESCKPYFGNKEQKLLFLFLNHICTWIWFCAPLFVQPRLLSYCLKGRKNTESKNPKAVATKNTRAML